MKSNLCKGRSTDCWLELWAGGYCNIAACGATHQNAFNAMRADVAALMNSDDAFELHLKSSRGIIEKKLPYCPGGEGENAAIRAMLNTAAQSAKRK